MKILIAADSFKGSLSSLEVAEAIERGIKKADSKIEVIKVGVADGGEGSMDALVLEFNGSYNKVEVSDPLNRKISANFGILDDNSVIIETASASGITLLSAKELNPFKTTTYGVGQLIKAALDLGYRNIYLGLGGSATNDGGVGMAQALGVLFLDKDNNEIPLGNQALSKIETIDISKLDPLIKKAKFNLLSDVNNVLYGKNGASYVFAKQKGASNQDIISLDNNLKHLSQKVIEFLNIDIANLKGVGAAGGLGYGLMVFLKAEMFVGVSKILELINIEKYLKSVDMVITGEGKMDSQTLYGKAPIGIARLAKKYDLFVLAIVGSLEADKSELLNMGIDQIKPILTKDMTLKYAIQNASDLIEKTSFEAISQINQDKWH